MGVGLIVTVAGVAVGFQDCTHRRSSEKAA